MHVTATKRDHLPYEGEAEVLGGALSLSSSQVPASTGGAIAFALHAGEENAHRGYLLLGGISGMECGIALPGGLAVLPIEWDVFTDFVLAQLNSPFFQSFLGKLDENGSGASLLCAPPLPAGFAGLRMYYAFCLAGPFDFASNPVFIDIVE